MRTPAIRACLALLLPAGLLLPGCNEADVDLAGEGVARYGYLTPRAKAAGEGADEESVTEIGKATAVAKAGPKKNAPSPKRRTRRGRKGKAGKYEVIEGGVKDGGTIKGVFKLAAKPTLAPIPITKDVAPCLHKEHPSERAVYDAETLALANCVVMLVDITKGKDWPESLRTKSRTSELDQVKCIYVPHILVTRTKTQIVVHNSDKAEHNIHGYLESMANSIVNAGTAAEVRNIKPAELYLKKAGKYILKCDIHPWMNAYIHVVANPYYAVTNAKGEFELKDVPPGKYTLRAWHESMAEEAVTSGPEITGYNYGPDWEETRSVTVEAGGTVTADFLVPLP